MKKNTEVSERINQLIDFIGVSKNDFAKKLGYERSQSIYDIVNGKSKPSFDFFEKLLNSEYSEIINVEYIITGKGDLEKTKCKENVPLEKGNNLGSILRNKPNVKKTLPSEPLPPEGSGTEVAALREVIEAQRQQISGLTQDKERLIIDIQEVKEEKNELKAEVKELRHQLELATREITYLKNVSSMGDTQVQVG